MDSDDEEDKISSSNYEFQKENIASSLTERPFLVHNEHNANIISSSRPHISIINNDISSSNSQLQRQSSGSSSHENFKKKCIKDLTQYISDVSYPNKTDNNSQYSNKNGDYSKLNKNLNHPPVYSKGQNYTSRIGPAVWQSTVSPDKSFVSLNPNLIDNLSSFPDNMLHISDYNKLVNNESNVSNSLIDMRSPMLSDFAHQNSNLLIENCLVSTSTGHLDSTSIPTITNIDGENADFLYNHNLLDVPVDSNTVGIIHSSSANNSANDFHSGCREAESSVKISSDIQNFQNEKYYIFDHIPTNSSRLNPSEICASDGSNLHNNDGPSGISRYSHTPKKFVKICEKSPQDKNIPYSIQNFPFDVIHSDHTSTDFLAIRDSVASTEFNEDISECDEQCTALNMNKLSNEFSFNKKLAINQETNMFNVESFHEYDYIVNNEEVNQNSRENFISDQHFLRDDLILRPIEFSMVNKNNKYNQQEVPLLSPGSYFSIENIDMNSPKDMTTNKRMMVHDSKLASNILTGFEYSSCPVGRDNTDTNIVPEDLSSPLKYKNNVYRECNEQNYLEKPIMITAEPEHSISKSSQPESPSCIPFDATIDSNDIDWKLLSNKKKAAKIFATKINNESSCNILKTNQNFEKLSICIPPKNTSYNQRKGYKFRSLTSKDNCETQSQRKTENVKPADVWCNECDKYLSSQCNVHVVRTITEKTVKARPWASIPSQYLCIKIIDNERNCNGVYTRKTLPRRVKFGPVQGSFVEGEPPLGNHFFVMRNTIRGYLDTSDDGKTNWMKFVRWAESFTEMNCVVVEEDNSIYFLTTVDIQKKKELKIGYSKQYSMKYGLQYIKPSDEELAALQPIQKWWDCFECDEKFKSSMALEEHLQLHDKDEHRKKKRKKTKYKMDYSYKNERSPNSDSGEKKIPGQSWYECEVCLLCFTNYDILLLHKELHSSENWNRIECEEKQVYNRCPMCSQMFDSRNDLSHHVNSHSLKLNDSPVKKLFKCKLCYKSFETENKLVSHGVVHVVNKDADHPCNRCHRSFSTLKILTSHQKFHKENSSEYVCPMCNEKFDSLSLLKGHIPEHNINGVYTCQYCQKTFPVYHKIRRHIRTYHPGTVHPCHLCGKTLITAEKLKLHMLIHSDRRDFICEICNRGFKRKDKLKEHQKRGHLHSRNLHKTIEKTLKKDIENFKYKCQLCIRGFKRRGMLVNHLSKMHPKIALDSIPELTQPILKECRIFFCHYCKKSYETSRKRKVHILKHHPGAAVIPLSAQGSDDKVCNTVVLTPKKAFAVSCSLCPRQYATNAKLLQHKRKHHKQEKSRKAKPKMVEAEQKTSEVIVTSSHQENVINNSQLIRLASLNPSVQLQLKDATRFIDGEELYVTVPTAQSLMLEGDFSEEQTLTVLSSNTDESFCVALPPGQLLSNIGVICQSDLPYTATPKSDSLVSEDAFQGDINFNPEAAAKGDCILTQVDSNSPLLLWQQGIFSNVN